jgi:hypothetical protein
MEKTRATPASTLSRKFDTPRRTTKKALAPPAAIGHGRTMPTHHAHPNQSSKARIEKRCTDCVTPPWLAKVPALSVSDTVRCDRCAAPLPQGAEFWAVVIDGDAGLTVEAGS